MPQFNHPYGQNQQDGTGRKKVQNQSGSSESTSSALVFSPVEPVERFSTRASVRGHA